MGKGRKPRVLIGPADLLPSKFGLSMTFRDYEFLHRPAVALDTETEAFSPGNKIPQLVSVALCSNPAGPVALYNAFLDPRAESTLGALLERAAAGKLLIVGQNLSYDFAVIGRRWPKFLSLIFDALDANSVCDTQTAAKFIANFHGQLFDSAERTSYSLGTQVKQTFGVELDKDVDGWRLRFGELLRVPIDQWPERARDYAKGDALWALRMWQHWVRHARELERQHALTHAIFGNLPARARVAFAAALASAWGIHTDPIQVANVELAAVTQAAKAHERLKAHGLLKVYTKAGRHKFQGREETHETGQLQLNPNGMPKKDLKALLALVERLAPPGYPRTKTGLSMDAAHLVKFFRPGYPQSDAPGVDPGMDAYIELAEVNKTITTWLPLLRQGITQPIHASVDELKNTGRLSYYSPNLQQLPRKAGVREAFVPRAGRLFCSVDYDGAELRAWGQVCLWLLGRSKMAAFFQKDPAGDAHAMLAARMLGMSYEQVLALKKSDPRVKEARQNAKPANFGFLANMGEKRFVATQAAADPPVVFTEPEAAALKGAFKDTWEAQPYFDYVEKRMGWDETVRGRSFGSNRYRGGMTYTALANSYFQQLIADGACEAFYEIVRHQYDPRHRLWPGYGSRTLVFIHDESFTEVDAEAAHEQAHAIRDVQVAALQKWVPDVPITAEPALMHRWSKGAEAVWDGGRLVPWVPKPKAV